MFLHLIENQVDNRGILLFRVAYWNGLKSTYLFPLNLYFVFEKRMDLVLSSPEDMKELLFIIYSNYRRPVPSKFKQKLMEHFRGSKIKPSRKIVSMKALYEERSSKTYIYYTYI